MPTATATAAAATAVAAAGTRIVHGTAALGSSTAVTAPPDAYPRLTFRPFTGLTSRP